MNEMSDDHLDWEALLVQASYGPWFNAAYPGDCDGCGASLDEGDRVRYDGDDQLLCEDCGEDGG